MNKTKRIFSCIMAVVFLLGFNGAYAFRDVTAETEEAAEELSASGMFESFIFKHGTEYFRPEGNVSRADLIMVLKEYYVVADRLIEQNRRILSDMQELQAPQLGDEELRMIVDEVKRELSPAVEELPEIKELEDRVERRLAASQEMTDSIDRRIVELKEEINMIKAGLPEDEEAAEPLRGEYIHNITERLENLDSKFSQLESSMNLISEKVDGDKLGRLSSGISELEQKLQETGAFELGEKLGEIDAIKSNVENLEQRMDDFSYQGGVRLVDPVAQQDTEGLPLWARVSIGFSALTLFFMSR